MFSRPAATLLETCSSLLSVEDLILAAIVAVSPVFDGAQGNSFIILLISFEQAENFRWHGTSSPS